MNFRNWLESVSSYAMGAPEAIEFLGLGADHTPEQLEDAYRRKVMEVHPDRGGDPVEFKKAQAAYERLKAGGQETSQGTGQPDPFAGRWGELHRELSRKMAPIGQYSAQEFEDWVGKVVQMNYFQVKSRHPVNYVTWGLKLGKDQPTMPLGSVTKTFRVTGYAKKGSGVQKAPKDAIMELFAPHMSRIPEFIVDMKVNEKLGEAWMTMEMPTGRYQTVSFAPVVKKEKKAEGVGMKKDEVKDHLASSGLTPAGSYTAGDNYGVSDSPLGYFVQVGSKVVRIIRRYHTDYHGRKKIETMNLASEHYGNMTRELLDKYIRVVRSRSRQTESFVHHGGMDRNFAMAVYSIMHNKADATDWDIIDSVPGETALQRIRSILSDNGMADDELEREMEWWKKQISSTGKWN